MDIESRMSKKVCDNLTHIVTDALVHSFPEMLARHQGNFDVAVCNPPFTLLNGGMIILKSLVRLAQINIYLSQNMSQQR